MVTTLSKNNLITLIITLINFLTPTLTLIYISYLTHTYTHAHTRMIGDGLTPIDTSKYIDAYTNAGISTLFKSHY